MKYPHRPGPRSRGPDAPDTGTEAGRTAPPVTWADPRDGDPTELARLLQRISRSQDRASAGFLGPVLRLVSLNSDERESLSRAVRGAVVGDRLLLLAGTVDQGEDNDVSVDPLPEIEADAMKEALSLVLPEIVGESAWRVQATTYAVPFADDEDPDEDEVEEEEEIDEDEIDEDEADEDEDEDEADDGDDGDREEDEASAPEAVSEEEVAEDGEFGVVLQFALLRTA